jgi:hypothetical protein
MEYGILAIICINATPLTSLLKNLPAPLTFSSGPSLLSLLRPQYNSTQVGCGCSKYEPWLLLMAPRVMARQIVIYSSLPER